MAHMGFESGIRENHAVAACVVGKTQSAVRLKVDICVFQSQSDLREGDDDVELCRRNEGIVGCYVLLMQVLVDFLTLQSWYSTCEVSEYILLA